MYSPPSLIRAHSLPPYNHSSASTRASSRCAWSYGRHESHLCSLACSGGDCDELQGLHAAQYVPSTIPPFQITNPPSRTRVRAYGMNGGRICGRIAGALSTDRTRSTEKGIASVRPPFLETKNRRQTESCGQRRRIMQPCRF